MLTPSGTLSPIMQQSANDAENAEIWESIPNFKWRIPVKEVKAGSDIIAYAEIEEDKEKSTEITAENAKEAMNAERQKRIENALIVTHNIGKGKVLQLNTDETWRLRYRKGDVYHHRFWGQILRWGLGERLRSGNNLARLGTDKITYTPNDSIRIMVRLQDKDANPINDASVACTIESSEFGVRSHWLRQVRSSELGVRS